MAGISGGLRERGWGNGFPWTRWSSLGVLFKPHMNARVGRLSCTEYEKKVAGLLNALVSDKKEEFKPWE